MNLFIELYTENIWVFLVTNIFVMGFIHELVSAFGGNRGRY